MLPAHLGTARVSAPRIGATADGGSVHSRKFRCDRTAPRRARGWVASIIEPGRLSDALHDDATYDVLLCVSELVTMSLIGKCSELTLQLRVDPSGLRVSLVDDSPYTENHADPGIRAQLVGFQVIDALVHRWGIEPTPDGRELWVEIKTPESEEPCA
jgi:hypothetical protein